MGRLGRGDRAAGGGDQAAGGGDQAAGGGRRRAPDRLFECLQAWRRATTAAPMPDIDPRPRRPRRRWSRDPAMPERARTLRATGLTMQEIAQLGCSVATVHRHVHNA